MKSRWGLAGENRCLGEPFHVLCCFFDIFYFLPATRRAALLSCIPPDMLVSSSWIGTSESIALPFKYTSLVYFNTVMNKHINIVTKTSQI